MANGDFKVTATHRYRPITPVAAGICAQLISTPAKFLWPNKSLDQERLLRYAFVLINATFFSLAISLLVHKIQIKTGDLIVSSIILLAMISSRWTIYMVGVPLTDSLYLLCLTILWLGLLQQSFAWVFVACLLGPLAKETFPLFLVLLFLPQSKFISLIKKATIVISSLGFWIGIRFLVDLIYGPALESTSDNLNQHLNLVPENLSALLSPNGLAQLFGTYGLFSFILFIPLIKFKEYFRNNLFKARVSEHMLLSLSWVFIVMVHVILSGDFSRMLFFASPAIVWLMADILSIQQIKRI